MNDMSLTCFKFASLSIAVQKIIGAAFLKFYQKSESSHSTNRFFKTLGSGMDEKAGTAVALMSLSTSSTLAFNLYESFSYCSLKVF